MSDDLRKAASRKSNKATFVQTLFAVLWSFFGVRKSASHNADMEKLNPIHVIIVGILAALLFVGGLLVIVQIVIRSAL